MPGDSVIARHTLADELICKAAPAFQYMLPYSKKLTLVWETSDQKNFDPLPEKARPADKIKLSSVLRGIKTAFPTVPTKGMTMPVTQSACDTIASDSTGQNRFCQGG